MPRSTDTIAALATPVGTAALAVLRVSGPDTGRLAEEIFGRTLPPRIVRHADYRDRAGNLIDDTVATFFQGPRSYTGEDALEISCHGNPFIAQKILEDLFIRGCRPAGPGEFTQRAFLNGRMDLSQAEAVMDVIHARSERALATANQQLRGSLGVRMNEFINRLLGVLSRIEAYIDFPDEDLPPEERGPVIKDLRLLLTDTKQLLATSHYGEILRDGIKTVIVGEPNVGKSSLLNRLVGRDRALVSPDPGTTRDFIEERVMVGSHSLRLIDTAGLNDSPAPLERLGITKTHECLLDADLLLIVLDATREDGVIPQPIRATLETRRHIILLNNSDLRNTLSSFRPWSGEQPIAVSALTGLGIEQLTDAVTVHADSFRNDIGSDAVAVNARHSVALGEANNSLQLALEKLAQNGPIELIASDLRTTLTAFGDITGRVDNERMLDQLFATFCIGK